MGDKRYSLKFTYGDPSPNFQPTCALWSSRSSTRFERQHERERRSPQCSVHMVPWYFRRVHCPRRFVWGSHRPARTR